MVHQPMCSFTFICTIGVWPRGITFPSPLFMHCPQCNICTYTSKTSKVLKKMWVFFSHCILILPSYILMIVEGPLYLYYPYGLILELLDLSVQYANLLHSKFSFLLHLDHIPINDMINIRYILFKK